MSENTINEKYLEEIEQRAAKATPGPWRMDAIPPKDGMCLVTHGPKGSWIGHIGIGCGEHPRHRLNAEFIAAAREDVPALVAEVRRLRARDNEREAWALRLLADAGDPVARALVHAPVIDGEPDPDEPPIADLRPEDWIPHEVVLQRLLDRAAAEHDALIAKVAQLRGREARVPALVEIDALITGLCAETDGEPIDLIDAVASVETGAGVAGLTHEDSAAQRDALLKCAAWALIAICELDRVRSAGGGDR